MSDSVHSCVQRGLKTCSVQLSASLSVRDSLGASMPIDLGRWEGAGGFQHLREPNVNCAFVDSERVQVSSNVKSLCFGVELQLGTLVLVISLISPSHWQSFQSACLE